MNIDTHPEAFRWSVAQVRLRGEYDVARLHLDLAALCQVCDPQPQYGWYHDGKWRGISLVNPSGDPRDTYPDGIGDRRFTTAVEHAPYLRQILEEFGLPNLRAARLLFLPPGAIIGEHADAPMTLRSGRIRLHLPVVTAPAVDLRIGGERCRWKEGELWYGDFSLIHSVRNESDVVRVHLVIDVFLSAVADRFPPDYVAWVLAEKGFDLAAFRGDGASNVVSAEELRSYCGRYVVPGRAMALALGTPVAPPSVVTVSVREGTLRAEWHGLADLSLIALGQDEFATADGWQVRFARGPGGEVSSATVTPDSGPQALRLTMLRVAHPSMRHEAFARHVQVPLAEGVRALVRARNALGRRAVAVANRKVPGLWPRFNHWAQSRRGRSSRG